MVKTVRDQGNSIAAPSSDIHPLLCLCKSRYMPQASPNETIARQEKTKDSLDHSKFCKKNCQEIDPHILIEHFIKAS
jgi:hypothetical protein